MNEARRKVLQFLEDNNAPEPWDHVNRISATTYNGEIVAVMESMDCGDAIVTVGEKYKDYLFRGEQNERN